MTPTPRTDAAIAASAGQWSFPLRDLARELERELAAERALADRLAFALTDSATWDHALPAHEAWKEARR
jgi:hypothetical protein